MVEIALCIAIIGFALVAIIGVLPTAMRVQQDNRGDTLIDQDGNYFLEAIRNGARGLDDVTNYVETFVSANNFPVRTVSLVAGILVTNLVAPKEYDTGEKLIGLLSSPRTNNDGFRVEAEFQAISGAAVEKDPNNPVAFKYVLTSEITPFSSLDSVGHTDKIRRQNGLHEVSLTFRWPLSPNTGQVGNNKRVFRTLSSAPLKYEPLGNLGHFFFEPGNFALNSP